MAALRERLNCELPPLGRHSVERFRRLILGSVSVRPPPASVVWDRLLLDGLRPLP
jgi:hypothetical protein